MKSRSLQRQLTRWATQQGQIVTLQSSSQQAHADRQKGARHLLSSKSQTEAALPAARWFSSSSSSSSSSSPSRLRLPKSPACNVCASSTRGLVTLTVTPSSASESKKQPNHGRQPSSFSAISKAYAPYSQVAVPSSRRLLHATSLSHQQQQTELHSPKSSDQSSSSSFTTSKSSNASETSAHTKDEASSSSSPSTESSSRSVSVGEIRRLARLAIPEKKTLGIALGLLAVSSAVSLSVPFTLGRIIDLFTSSSTANLPVSVPTAAAILAAVFAIGAAANTGRSILMRIAGQRIVTRVREDAYANTLRLDMAKYDLMGQNLDANGQPKQIVPPSKADATQSSTRLKDEENDLRQPALAVASSTDSDSKDNTVEGQKSSKRGSLTSALSLAGTEGTPDVGVRGVGDVISRLGSDSSIVGESLTRELSEGLRSLATVIVGVGMMVYISAKLTVLMLCIVPPSAIGAVVYGRYLKKLSRRTQKKIGEMIALAEERLSSIRTVQAFNGVVPVETKAFGKKANEILDLAKKEAYASGLFYGGAGFSGNITMLALLSYGGKLVSQGEITVGDLSSLMLYTAYVGGSLVSLTSFFSTVMKGLGAAARVFELLDAKPASVQLSQGIKLLPTTPAKPLSFNDVHFSYPSRPSVPILKGLNLDIQKGKSIAVAGGSGSGKSTLVNLLVRFYDPNSGDIRYGDEDIRKYTPESWRERVSMVPQDPALFSQTIAENIAYGKQDATMSEIREAARLANCDFIEDLPLGFDTLVGPKAAQLSGGQRQRIAIARALVRKPSILILDEATSALDAASETLVNEAVRNITSSHSLTTILIAHRLSTLKTADEIVFMQNGQVVERGTYEELAREGTEFWNLVRSQMLGSTGRLTTSQPEEQLAQQTP